MLTERALQGVGSGVIPSLVEIILANLVPLSERFVCQSFHTCPCSNKYSTSTPTEADIKERWAQYGHWPLQLVSYFLFHNMYNTLS
jgi:hypothetical protein